MKWLPANQYSMQDTKITLKTRISFSGYLLLDIVRRFPLRVIRLILHITAVPTYLISAGLYGVKLRFPARLLLWCGELLFLLMDLAGITECYEIGSHWLKPRSRPLQPQEITWARAIFGNTIPYRRIRIDESAHIGPRQYHFCYVSFCVINSWRAMPPAVLIHELMHVWQFERYGSPYILRALLAQHTLMGYDYGGLIALQAARAQHLGFLPFNYEQQASIIEDLFRLQQQQTRGKAAADPAVLDAYRYFAGLLGLDAGNSWRRKV